MTGIEYLSTTGANMVERWFSTKGNIKYLEFLATNAQLDIVDMFSDDPDCGIYCKYVEVLFNSISKMPVDPEEWCDPTVTATYLQNCSSYKPVLYAVEDDAEYIIVVTVTYPLIEFDLVQIDVAKVD